jgi:hypothetical protein
VCDGRVDEVNLIRDQVAPHVESRLPRFSPETQLDLQTCLVERLVKGQTKGDCAVELGGERLCCLVTDGLVHADCSIDVLNRRCSVVC